MTDLNLNRVAVFVRVIEKGGFTAAAQSLGIPKSSASRSVRQLEESLGVQLVQRTTRRLRLTAAGQAYYERAAAALAELDEARAITASAQEEPSGQVRLAVPPGWQPFLVAPIVASFVAQYPKVRVEVSATGRDVDLVRDGFDLAIRMGALTDSSLVRRSLGLLTGALFASTQYVARRGLPRTVADLAAHDLIGFRREGAPVRLKLDGPKGPETIVLDGPVATDDVHFVLEAVLLGMGIGLLPISTCTARLDLVRVMPDYVKAGVECSLVYAPAKFLPVRVALLRDALVSGLRNRLGDADGTVGPCDALEGFEAGSRAVPAAAPAGRA